MLVHSVIDFIEIILADFIEYWGFPTRSMSFKIILVIESGIVIFENLIFAN